MTDSSKQDEPIAPRWLRVVGLISLALGLSVFAWQAMLSSYPHSQIYDGGYIHWMMEAARVAVARWHELPLWNPYQCGGLPLWDNPHGMGATPLYWPIFLLTDTTRAIEIWYVLHSAAGFVCMYLFMRHEVRISRAASLVSAAMWAFCGAHTQHITGGGFNWVPFFFLPMMLMMWRRAENDARYAVGLGVFMSLQIWGGAAYPVAFMTLIIAGETLTRIWPVRRVGRIARAGVIVVAVAFCLAAGRFIPVIYQLASHKREIVDNDALQWTTLKEMFLSRTHSRAVTGQQYVWPEFGDYLGPILLTLALVGVIIAGIENLWLLALLVLSFLLMLGHKYPWAPWQLLNAAVPPYKSMRVPSRFNITVTLFLAAFAGIAVDRLSTFARRLSGSVRVADAFRTGIVILAFVGVGDMIGVGMDWSDHCFKGPIPDRKIAVAPNFYIDGPGLGDLIDQPQQNRGRSACWEEWAFGLGAAIWTGDSPQARAQDRNKIVVENVKRTQSTFTFDADVKEPSRVLLNTSWDAGWRTDLGTVVNDNKLLAVDLPAGHTTVRVKYWPRGLTFGLVLTLVSIAATAAYYVWEAKRRKRAAA